ncbi:hypothetical protein MNBD_GAMMA09-2178 [hydrothermal vent metagenome]|uniref:Uncharacterized protein n=1 Tax=hydrothermal vent metagenome TaxID=652676 RepID=A0A3B0XSH0_9ZZZZ
MSIYLLGRVFVLLLVLSVLVLQGCATTAEKTANMRKLMEINRTDLALIEAEKHLAEHVEGVMENMNVGVLRRLNGDYRGSNEAFEIAKKKIDELYSTSVSEQASALMTNDESISFQGEKFEQVLIHLYMASNYLSLHEVDAARVELLQSQVKMDEWGEPKDETPFMRYFSGILFEILGEEDSATVSYRKAVDAYINTKARHGLNVPLALKYDLLRMLSQMQLKSERADYEKQFNMTKYKAPNLKGKGELIVVFGNGMAPQRNQKFFKTWSTELSANIKVAVPDYPNPPVVLNKVRLRVDGKRYPLEVVSNIDGLARSALAEDMPLITTRAIARAVLKKKSEEEAGKQNGYAQAILFILNKSTEIADTRSWNTLPQEFEIARVYLPAGEYDVVLEVVNASGHIIDTINRKVNIKVGEKSVISKRWTSPEPKDLPVHPVGVKAVEQAATVQ